MIKKEIILVTVDNIEFKIQEYNWKKSLTIQKLLGEILAPVLNVLSLNSGKEGEDKKILDRLEIQNLGNSIRECLMSVPDLFEFFKQIFSNTFIVKENKSGQKGDLALDSDEVLNDTFHKKTMTAFKLIFEVMKVNELGFTSGGGGFDLITGIFKNIMQESNVK